MQNFYPTLAKTSVTCSHLMLHILYKCFTWDQVQSEKCPDIEKKRLWTRLVQDQDPNRFNTIIIIITRTMFMVLSSWQSLREFTRFIWWMQTECRVAVNPQTKPTDLGCESAERLAATTIAIYYYYSAHKLILIIPFHTGWKAESTSAL